MAVPEFQAFWVPVLNALSDGQTRHWREVREPVARELGLTDEDHDDQLPSGQTRFDSRVQWSITHLFQAGLLARPKRGHVVITARGREVLAEHPDRVDIKLLGRFEEYRDFRTRTRAAGRDAEDDAAELDDPVGTPPEAIEKAVRESNAALASEVLERVFGQEPVFLERLVLTLLTAMGYGGRAGAAEHWGGSGDGGIDGVVRQDVLGLDRVYV
ncbi:hypothetical protein GCM10023192_35300 [Amycolatopsis samaneae]